MIMITQSQKEDIMPIATLFKSKQQSKQREVLTVPEREAVKIQEAVFLEQVGRLKYQIGQRMRITIDREEDRLRRAEAVVVQDCKRIVVLDVMNRRGRAERISLIKADILRRNVGVVGQTKGALKIELY